jgi:hypothetical protein
MRETRGKLEDAAAASNSWHTLRSILGIHILRVLRECFANSQTFRGLVDFPIQSKLAPILPMFQHEPFPRTAINAAVTLAPIGVLQFACADRHHAQCANCARPR